MRATPRRPTLGIRPRAWWCPSLSIQTAFAQRRTYRNNKVEPELFMHEMKRYRVVLTFRSPRGERACFSGVLLSPADLATVAAAAGPIGSRPPRPSRLRAEVRALRCHSSRRAGLRGVHTARRSTRRLD